MLFQDILPTFQSSVSYSSYLKVSSVRKDTLGSVWLQYTYTAWLPDLAAVPQPSAVSQWASLSMSPVSTSGSRCSSWDQSKLSHLTCWLRLLQDSDLMSIFSNPVFPFRKQLFTACRLASWLYCCCEIKGIISCNAQIHLHWPSKYSQLKGHLW